MAIRVEINRLEDRVAEYEKELIEEGKILFIGDSRFTLWRRKSGAEIPMEEAITGKDGKPAVINHGFGGSTMEEALYYYPRLVRPWKPKAIVLNTFVNDRPQLYTPDELMFMLERFFEYARVDMPGIKLYLCDVGPHCKILDDDTKKLWLNHVYAMNQRLKEYADSHDDVTLIQLSREPMFFISDEDIGNYERVRDDIFVDDRIHFNNDGYKLFAKIFKKALADIL